MMYILFSILIYTINYSVINISFKNLHYYLSMRQTQEPEIPQGCYLVVILILKIFQKSVS